MITNRLREQFRFFHDNAGWSTPPGKAACALSLARAETAAEELGIEFTWETDDDIDDSWMDERERAKPHEWLICRAVLGDRVLAALCGIVDPDRTYGRVVEAELAQEAIDELNATAEAAYA